MSGGIVSIHITYELVPPIQIDGELAKFVSYTITNCGCGCTKSATASLGDENSKILGVYDVSEGSTEEHEFLYNIDYIPGLIKDLFTKATMGTLIAIDNCQNDKDPMEDIGNALNLVEVDLNTD